MVSKIKLKEIVSIKNVQSNLELVVKKNQVPNLIQKKLFSIKKKLK